MICFFSQGIVQRCQKPSTPTAHTASAGRPVVALPVLAETPGAPELAIPRRHPPPQGRRQECQRHDRACSVLSVLSVENRSDRGDRPDLVAPHDRHPPQSSLPPNRHSPGSESTALHSFFLVRTANSRVADAVSGGTVAVIRNPLATLFSLRIVPVR